ncbi:MAG: hypothetical protein QM790_20935 [Nibricoccus sp.]
MEAALDIRRWEEKPAGVMYRRWVITSNGLQQLMKLRVFKGLLVVAWIAGILLAAAGFLFTQTLASGGWLENWAIGMGPRAHAVVSAFCSMVLLYPDICIHGLFSTLFWWHSMLGLGLSMVALSVVLPRLVARDRASNALTIYLSRPLTSYDYLLGKFGIILGILVLLWTGPLLFGWLLSMAFAPNTDFFVYSLTALGRALLFNVISLITLSSIALGISSLGKNARAVTAIWMGTWLIIGGIANIPSTPNYVRALSFSHDLKDVRQEIFKLDEILEKASESLPMVKPEWLKGFQEAQRQIDYNRDAKASAVGLVVLVIASSFVFARRLRPE